MKKLTILVFVPLILLVISNASQGAEYWAKSYGGSKYEAAFSGLQTTDGGYIVAGYTASFGVGSGFWILQLDIDGSITWEKTYEGDYAYAIQQTTDGGSIVAGALWFFDRDYDFKVLKLDSSGNISWQKTYGGSNSEKPHSIQQTADGGYIVAGYTGIDVDSDLWLLKLDGSGNISWQKTYGGDSLDFFPHASIQQTTDGGYIVAGDTGSFGAGHFDSWVLKLDGDGNVIWQKTYGGPESDRATSIQQTADGGYIVAGSTDSFGAGLSDNWVLKLDSDGNVIWQKTYGGSGGEFYSSIKQTTDGGYAMASITDSFGGGYFDIWLIKLDNNGNVLWEKTYGGSNDEQVWSFQQSTDGGYLISGYTASFCTGGRDLWVLKLNDNGEIPGCDIMGTSSAIVSGTFVSGVDTSITGQPYSAIPEDATITPQDTSAEINTVCYANCEVDEDCMDNLFCNGVENCEDNICQNGDDPCPDDELYCNGVEGCDEVNDNCTHSGNPCEPPYICDEVNDQCLLADTIITPGDIFCTPGQTNACKKPICLDNPETLVGGIQFDLCEYDTADNPIDCMACIDCELTERTTMFDCAVLELPNGCCRLILFCKNPGCAINPGLCNIVTIVYEMFDLSEDCPGISCITQIPENIIASNYEGYELTTAGLEGTVCPFVCGDVCPPDDPLSLTWDCGDGVVDIYDVMCEVDFALTAAPVDDCQAFRADVPTGTPPSCNNPDGIINILDIMVIIDMALNRQDCCTFYYTGVIY